MDEMKEVPAGLRLILEEIRDIRQEIADINRRSDEDRRRADAERRRADQDRRRADERFERIVRESKVREKGLRDVLVIIGRTGRQILTTLKEHTKLLNQISRKLDFRVNGRHGTGHAAA